MSDVFKTGVIPPAGFVVENIAAQKLPASISLTDTNVSRLIELSWDNTNYVAPALTLSSTEVATVALLAPAHSCKITGTPGAAYTILSAP